MTSLPHQSPPVTTDAAEAPYDPLRLCIFATIALLGWALGPFALLFFAALGFAGYVKARRAGLTHSKCFLRDTRLVLGYLAVLMTAGAVGIWLRVV
jgi:flagellar biosynthesis protein FliR